MNEKEFEEKFSKEFVASNLGSSKTLESFLNQIKGRDNKANLDLEFVNSGDGWMLYNVGKKQRLVDNDIDRHLSIAVGLATGLNCWVKCNPDKSENEIAARVFDVIDSTFDYWLREGLDSAALFFLDKLDLELIPLYSVLIYLKRASIFCDCESIKEKIVSTLDQSHGHTTVAHQALKLLD